MESLITTELENAILDLEMRYKPAAKRGDPVAEERKLTRQTSDRVLDVLADVSYDFTEINRGEI